MPRIVIIPNRNEEDGANLTVFSFISQNSLHQFLEHQDSDGERSTLALAARTFGDRGLRPLVVVLNDERDQILESWPRPDLEVFEGIRARLLG
jgi:hypothetical protein